MAPDISNPRVLLFSQRNIFKALFRSSLYEFENVISEVDSVDVLAPKANLSTLRHKLSRFVAFHAPVALNPGVPKTPVTKQYDVFLAICGAPQDLLLVNAVSDFRKVCKTSICLMDELWVRQIPDYRHFLHIFKTFDVVLLYYNGTVKPLSEVLGKKCIFLPPGVDTIRFCPYPESFKRTVDVYSIGRRSDITHRKLQKMATDEGLFYLHDSIAGDQAIHSADHRILFSNVAKRSRYFIVNPGLIDRPNIRGDQIEIGNRYFEGAAAGAIMLGERPRSVVFDQLFDWPDAVVDLPYDSANIDEVIHELDGQPERQERIRQTNVIEALRRHDWAYRWEAILKTIGLEPTPELLQRKERLKNMASALEQDHMDRLSMSARQDRGTSLQH